jgi:iron complex transport system ATP-binding protein
MTVDVRNLTVGYGAQPVLSNLSMKIPEGKITTLIGANGSGKSTLIKTIARILRPSGGAVLLDGKEVHRCDTRELARRMAVLSQTNSAPDDLTVEELVEYGRFPHLGMFRSMNAEDFAVVDEALAMTGLDGFRKRPVSTLSGGERQCAWIALTLAQRPQVLLLDEPTTFLDICHQFEVIDLILRMNRTLGITILMVLHDISLAARCSHRIVAIKDRCVYCEGVPGEVITPDVLHAVFEIEAKVFCDEEGIPHFIPVGSTRQNRRDQRGPRAGS